MKNVLIISTTEEEMLSNVNDGTNRLFINGSEIPSSDWTGTGNYTATVEGHTVTIAKIDSTDGNISLARTGDYTYEMRRRTPSGEVPDITASASVDANTGTPSVNVTKSGTDMNPNFDFAFHNLKGETGATGATGAAAGFGTPTASVDANIGTPSVTVTASGADTAKVFDFAFHNMKGDTASLIMDAVDGVDFLTAITAKANIQPCGAFFVKNATIALNYPETASYMYITYFKTADSRNIICTAYMYQNSERVYMCAAKGGAFSATWKKYRATESMFVPISHSVTYDLVSKNTEYTVINDWNPPAAGMMLMLVNQSFNHARPSYIRVEKYLDAGVNGNKWIPLSVADQQKDSVGLTGAWLPVMDKVSTSDKYRVICKQSQWDGGGNSNTITLSGFVIT